MRRTVLWDSSAVLALLDADDADHRPATAIARRLAKEQRPSYVTNYVEVETHALLLRKLGRHLAGEWLFTGALPVLHALPHEEQRAKELLARYTDKDWSLCDAISFAVIEARRIGAAFTFDRHFLQYGRFEVLGRLRLNDRQRRGQSRER
ncbi:MAG TPA: PIN domain-containing protein [Thermoanaerobaculia bacterium]|jgi:predicted nucleic acid-binding protein|nr:PIN domain-containing protein [Thermoanaerobaculia bacterium]